MIYSNTVVIYYMFWNLYLMTNISDRLYLFFQRLYRDVLNIYNMLYNQLNLGVCLGLLRSTCTPSMFKMVTHSACTFYLYYIFYYMLYGT